mgnify:FL=1
MDNNTISLLAEQNEILKAQLSEQRMINQQMFEMLKAISASLNLNSMNINQNSKEEQETESLTAFL